MPVRMKWSLALPVVICLYFSATADTVLSEPGAVVDERPVTVETLKVEVANRTGTSSTTVEKQALPDAKETTGKSMAQISLFVPFSLCWIIL